jgi:hypothetical protein
MSIKRHSQWRSCGSYPLGGTSYPRTSYLGNRPIAEVRWGSFGLFGGLSAVVPNLESLTLEGGGCDYLKILVSYFTSCRRHNPKSSFHLCTRMILALRQGIQSSLAVWEAARLQPFPDNYFFQGNCTQQFHQIGNAVPPYLAHKIAEIVRSIIGK